jgi:hypothetical protein
MEDGWNAPVSAMSHLPFAHQAGFFSGLLGAGLDSWAVPRNCARLVPERCRARAACVRFHGRIRSDRRSDTLLEREDAAKPSPPAIIQGGLP